MILQALTEHFEALVKRGKLEPPGWADSKISFALYIGRDGALEQVAELRQPDDKGKLRPRPMSLPAPEKRTVGIAPNFLWDNSSYLLGADAKGKPERSAQCFSACRALHHRLLDAVDSPAAKALLAFFDRWEPDRAAEHPALAERREELFSGANLVFRFEGDFVHDDPLIRRAWQEYYDSAGGGPEMVCLVTGKKGPAEAVHPSVKGVRDAQSSGAALVSFNADAFCSYGKEQSLNAPTGKYAAFAYTAALNHLLADREHVSHIGDTTVLFWARDGKVCYQDFFAAYAFGESAKYTAGDLAGTVQELFCGRPVLFDSERLDPQMDFYLLGLSPNAARLSVRFFLRNHFGGFLESVQKHYARLEIARPAYDSFETLALWRLLEETVNQKSKDKSPAPGLAGEMLRAVLTDTRYPSTLLSGATLRIRAEREINRGRAAILKAYYLKNQNPYVPKEVLTVSLNPDCNNTAYVLGRLFSVLEGIQSAASPGVNTTIKDKHFNSASATPSRVFPLLINLAQKHLQKLERGLAVSCEKQLEELIGRIGTQFPDRMNLPQQGAFQLGYYHQTQARYQKKEEKKDV